MPQTTVTSVRTIRRSEPSAGLKPARESRAVGSNGGETAAGLDAALAGNPAAMAFAPDASTAVDPHAGLDVSGSVSLTRRLAAVSRWRDFYDPLAGFNVARARALAEDYTRGWFADLQWTYFFLEGTDPDLFALVDRRTSRLLEMDYTVKLARHVDPARKSAASAPRHFSPSDLSSSALPASGSLRALADEQADLIRAKLEKIDNLYEAIEHLAMASFRGYAHCEKWHGADGDINHLEIVDQWNIVRDGFRGGWKYNPRAWQTGYYGLGEELAIDPANFLTFTVTASGSPTLTYQWKWNGTNIGGATSSSYAFTASSVSAGGTLSVTVTNSLGSATASTAVRVDQITTTLTGSTTVASGGGGGGSWSFSASTTAAGGLSHVAFHVSGHGSALTSTSGASYSGSASWGHPFGSPDMSSTPGSYTFYMYADDANGRTHQTNLAVTVV